MIKINTQAKKCLNILNSHGYEAFLVGGCVRDALLGRVCEDIDITTNASPEQVINIFEHTIPTGIKHGTITVIIDKKPIEVTTYRIEGSYTDSRHPDSVTFVSDLSQDLSRRDFTINALAYNQIVGLVDYHRGIEDLNKKIIRTVGDPKKRFEEDALRIFRAVRFSCTLGFEIEKYTKIAISLFFPLLTKVSGERVLQELYKLSCAKKFDSFLNFINSGGLAPFGIYSSTNSNCFSELSSLCQSADTKLILLLSLTEHSTDTIINKLKVSKKVAGQLRFLDTMSNSKIIEDKISLKRLLSSSNIENVTLYITYISLFSSVSGKLMQNLLEEILSNKEPFRVSDLEISGTDLVDLGYTGADVGILLGKALDYIIMDPLKNNKHDIISFIQNI